MPKKPVTALSFTMQQLEAYALSAGEAGVHPVQLTHAAILLVNAGLMKLSADADNAMTPHEVRKALQHIERTGKPYPKVKPARYIVDDLALLKALYAVVRGALFLDRHTPDASYVTNAFQKPTTLASKPPRKTLPRLKGTRRAKA